MYRPYVTLYKYQTGELIGEGIWLPSVKIINPEPQIAPQHDVGARFAEMATLLGYDLTLPEAGVRAGRQFTLTLYYQSDAPAPLDYTRFVHLSDMQDDMAAQTDSPPAGGRNPTSTWMPGEIIVDRVRLTVKEDAVPGVYSLRVGLYDPANGVRVPVADRAGSPQPDGQIVLTDVPIEK